MARQRMVTRTIETNVFHCMVVSGTEVKENMVTLGNLDGVKTEKIEKALKEKCENDGVLFVKINRHEKVETVMGMTEDDFIRYAKVIER